MPRESGPPLTVLEQKEPFQDDMALVQASLKQKPGAFDLLVKRYLPLVYNTTYRFVGDADLAQDLTQETFIRAYRALDRYHGRSPFKNWLLKIAVNVSKTALKKRQKGAILLDTDGDDRNMLENMSQWSESDPEVRDEQNRHVVEKALGALPEPVRQALVLRHVHDLSYEEVAEAMGAKLNTVRTWLKRGREGLKQILTEQGVLEA